MTLAKEIVSLPLFNGLDVSYIKSLLSAEPIRRFKQDEYLFHQGDAVDYMYILLEGNIDIIINYSDSDKQKSTISQLEPGAILGEVSLLIEQTRTASAFAVTDCKLAMVSNKAFKQQVKDKNKDALLLSHNIAVYLAKRLDQATRRFDELLQNIKNKEVTNEISLYKEKLLSELYL